MNVLYGYTGASYSGRMPCNDIADSVVETGKWILEDTIQQIELNKKWDCKVIYGDTDSVFVLFKGRTIKQAHSIS